MSSDGARCGCCGVLFITLRGEPICEYCWRQCSHPSLVSAEWVHKKGTVGGMGKVSPDPKERRRVYGEPLTFYHDLDQSRHWRGG